MKLPEKLADWVLVAFLIGQAIVAVYIFQYHPPQERRIDCGVAEFHPDYTTEMKEECRLIRSNRLL